MSFETMISDLVKTAVFEALQNANLEPLSSLPVDVFESSGIKPLKVYSVAQAAEYLGISETSLHRIPEEDLPRARRSNGYMGFHGINLIAYSAGSAPINVSEYVESYRTKLQSQAPAIKPIGKGKGSTRIY